MSLRSTALTAFSGVGHTPCVRSFVPRRFSVFIVLAAIAFPWVLAVGIAAHLAQHDHGPADHADEIQVALHGHHHDRGTPDHQHSLVVAKVAPLPTKVSLVLTPASLDCFVDRPSSLMRGSRWTASVGHSPPPPTLTFSILRI